MNLTRSGLVSAVIPTRNRPELVMKAMQSALHQTHPWMEVVVVIDGEDPVTEKRLARIDDIRLRVIPLPVNVGGSEARNIGVRAARGEWIAFLDDDDEWLPQKISLQLAAAQSSKSVFLVISSELIVRTQDMDFAAPLRPYKPEQPFSEHLFCRRRFNDGPYAMQTSTLFVSRDMMLTIPFRPGLKRHQDWDWLLRASCHPGVSFQVIPAHLTIFRVEDARPSVSRALDWQFSLQWAQDLRSCFTPKAYSSFVATECISRAMKSRAGAAVYTWLAREFIVSGAPTFHSVAWLAAFVCFPQTLRARLRRFLRRRQSATAPVNSGANTHSASFYEQLTQNITV